jgi:hypothetical protein
MDMFDKVEGPKAGYHLSGPSTFVQLYLIIGGMPEGGRGISLMRVGADKPPEHPGMV